MPADAPVTITTLSRTFIARQFTITVEGMLVRIDAVGELGNDRPQPAAGIGPKEDAGEWGR
ncbi:MAG: hypothetical protein WB662_03320, partial [Methyloceanibacter sp.]